MKRWYAPPVLAAIWVALEWTHAYTGFEWLNLGNAGSDLSMLLRLAPITGVWGISFAFALMSGVIAHLFLRRRGASVWLLAFLGLYLLPDIPAPVRGDANAVLVQPNIDGDVLWTPELLETVESQLRTFSASPVTRASGADLIVWPEMPVPFYETDAAFRAFLASVSEQAKAPILTGVVGRTTKGAPLNSGLLTGLNGATISRYDKTHLVPFGEFVPWPFGGLTEKISSEAGDYAAGSGVVVSKLGTHRIGTFICYESVFPSYIRQFPAAGAEVLFNISNDGWFGTSPARYQHLRIVRMRAAEVQRWILRGTNNGVTAAIDPAGRIVRSLPEYRQAAARFSYAYRTNLTFYTRFGDWFVGFCWALGLIMSIWTSPPWGAWGSSSSLSSPSPSSGATIE
jgi:apolipoprotein N-acyltransferase